MLVTSMVPCAVLMALSKRIINIMAPPGDRMVPDFVSGWRNFYELKGYLGLGKRRFERLMK